VTVRTALRRAGTTLLLLAVPMASWWLIGDLSEPFGDYHQVDPLHIDLGDEATFGSIALVTGVVGLAVILAARWSPRPRPTGWDRAIAAVVGAEVLAMLTYRSLTAGTQGSNIGGGLLLIGGPVAIGLLLAWALEQVNRSAAFGALAPSRKEIVLRLTVAHFFLGVLHPWIPALLLGGAIAFVATQVAVATPPAIRSPDAR